MSDLKGRDFFNKKGGGNKLNIICSLTENLDEFKNQHIETCFEIKQVCTSIFKICFDIRWFFCKILCLYDAAISHIFLFCKNFTLFQMSITFPKIVIILMKFSLAYFAIFHFFNVAAISHIFTICWIFHLIVNFPRIAMIVLNLVFLLSKDWCCHFPYFWIL